MKRPTPAISLAWLVALLATGVAIAHADLASSNPGDGTIVTARIDHIELVFSQAIETQFSIIKLYPLVVATSDHGSDETSAQDQDESDQEHEEQPGEGGEHGHDDDHGAEDGSTHALLDAAAEALVTRVLGLDDDHDARVEISVTPATGGSERITLIPRAALESGAYVVMWRALSADGHTIEGFLTFDYRPEHAD
ncbi:MAG: copper resistance protein CopC [Trueperaceae bacterium]|nr:copper resistance protein CopC [Trueperaceae bacterium]